MPTGSFLDSDDDHSWRRVIDIDLTAALHGVQLAARQMSAAGGGDPRGGGGTIMVVASAGGVFPSPGCPVYAGAKAALVHFVRSIEGQLRERGVRIVALCPQVRHPADVPPGGRVTAASRSCLLRACQANVRQIWRGSAAGRCRLPTQSLSAAEVARRF